ncbi:MAG: hypothetical protein A3G39_09200 [Deltaproteobacteria bacterium RIFCSPLOWO2_12_FULL_43_16]|nr:MAG: hypothetical protein A2Z89_04435 [Deltaproteobacteria bacterium GWA2_43_19]OGQ09689.1 MAG: hypothetical protein A3D30_00145 [Deltaproteobacteria bacterium RIFCSPHIGHO2_02_FULL_43_33]OGQ45641.1 MAG: hypothetical protein A2W63_03615 [Deltaproteobacteria bacterium RIFCSPLOWO2_02_44_9]OGQ60166.1 MAG: hypothetical protein A3G39_09200 [Deltaproteobacteria bacterium RIFCSPLOWO2_12_FULL_43_16]HBR17238.1 hypothetical protein [Deltaproteobacteria bacterium]
MLSIIIPAYNEEKRIAAAITKILHYLSVKDFPWEIILADDGSIDRTLDVAREIIKSNLTVIKNPVNQGKGSSVKKGVLASNAEVILFSDADLSTALKNWTRYYP